MTGAAACGHRTLDGPSIYALEKAAIRSRSLRARDELACAAANDFAGAAALIAMAHAAQREVRLTDHRALAALARVIGVQGLEPSDAADAIALYDLWLGTWSSSKRRLIDAVLHADLLISAGRLEAANRIIESEALGASPSFDRRCLRANLLRAAGQDEDAEWICQAQALFSDLAPVSLAAGSEPAFQRLTCTSAEREDGPLVTVLMAAYNPGAEIDTAVQSVLNQSWRNLELIIVDDASESESGARIAAWPARDSRVRVLRNPVNLGAYASRNRGLEAARGAFVTCHDADDWSHPSKLAMQVGALAADERSVGNLSQWVRADADLRFVLFSGSGRFVYPNMSSLLFRREPVVERAGYWEGVRFGADSEYARRIEHTFGQSIANVGEHPLALGQVRPGSLTDGALWRGWESAARRDYRRAWQWRHRNGRASVAAQAGRSFDRIIVGDFRSPHALARLRPLLAPGVAICQIDTIDPNLIACDQLDDAIQALVCDGILAQLGFSDKAVCNELVVLFTPHFELPRATGISPDKVTPSVLPGEDEGAAADKMARLWGEAVAVNERLVYRAGHG